jgi:hypothetical protein
MSLSSTEACGRRARSSPKLRTRPVEICRFGSRSLARYETDTGHGATPLPAGGFAWPEVAPRLPRAPPTRGPCAFFVRRTGPPARYSTASRPPRGTEWSVAVGVRILGAVPARHRLPAVRTLALRARRERSHGLDAELVAAVRAAIGPCADVASDGCCARHVILPLRFSTAFPVAVARKPSFCGGASAGNRSACHARSGRAASRSGS